MSARDRIIALLKAHPNGLDDDLIAERLGLPQRQQANAGCRQLAREGLVERRSVGGKIRNVLTGVTAPVMVRAEAVLQMSEIGSAKPWSWEGNVVRALTSLWRWLSADALQPWRYRSLDLSPRCAVCGESRSRPGSLCQGLGSAPRHRTRVMAQLRFPGHTVHAHGPSGSPGRVVRAGAGLALGE